jgi:hypothetical protein
MAFKKDIDDANGQTYGYWYVPIAQQQYDNSRCVVDVIGYRSKAVKDAGKQGWARKFVIEGAAWQKNMSVAEIEAAIMALPEFVGAVTAP